MPGVNASGTANSTKHRRTCAADDPATAHERIRLHRSRVADDAGHNRATRRSPRAPATRRLTARSRRSRSRRSRASRSRVRPRPRIGHRARDDPRHPAQPLGHLVRERRSLRRHQDHRIRPSRSATTASTARESAPASSPCPARRECGMSSTVRCRSSVNARRSRTPISIVPRVRARATTPSVSAASTSPGRS